MDKYEFQDLKYSGDYLQESMIVDLLHQVHQEVRKDATSPVTCVAAMRTLSSNGYDAIEEIKSKLIAINITQFAGENVCMTVNKIHKICNWLDNTSAFKSDLLCVISCII